MEDFLRFAIQDRDVSKIQERKFNSKLLVRLLNYKKESEVEDFLIFYLKTPEIHDSFTWFEEDIKKIDALFPILNIRLQIKSFGKPKAARSLRFGKLIVIEGTDGVGKTTQTRLLANALSARNEKNITIAYPDRSTPIGNLLDRYLKNEFDLPFQSLHLLFSANRWEKNEEIHQLLAEGVTVILDRYLYSGVAYSMANGLEKEWCCTSDKGLVLPDVLIYLENENLEQVGEERYDKDKLFQTRVVQAYWNLISPQWHVISKGTIEEVHKQILALV